MYAPIHATVEMVFDTKHAISMKSESGIEILVHVGLDTVTLKGEPFKHTRKAGDKVKAGDLLLEFDIDAIKNAGLEVVSRLLFAILLTIAKSKTTTGKTVGTKDQVMTIIK